MIKILFIGDIVGKSGRNVVLDNISSLRNKYDIDVVIANAENSAHGKGITQKIYQQLVDAKIDALTMGNHTFSKDMIYDFIDDAKVMVRPINMEPYNLGNNYLVLKVKNKRLCIYNVLGNVFMDVASTSCFKVTNDLLNKVDADYYLCDFHGEATSEKIAYAFHYQNRIHAVIGTHTHVQTADERIIGKMAFISDVGMCGAYESVLGRDVQETLQKIVLHDNTRYQVAEGPAIFCGVIITLDENTNRAVDITRLQIRPN